EPPNSAIDDRAMLSPQACAVRLREIHPRAKSSADVVGVGEPQRDMQMRHAPPLPLGDPVKPNHTGTPHPRFPRTPQLVPSIGSWRTVPQGERERDAGPV